MLRTWQRCTSHLHASSSHGELWPKNYVNINRIIFFLFLNKLKSENRTHYHAHTQYQSAHSNQQLSPTQVRHAPADPPADPGWRATLVFAIKYRNPPATRRRRIRQRASTNFRGRAASCSALVQPPPRSPRSCCEPTVDPTDRSPDPAYRCSGTGMVSTRPRDRNGRSGGQYPPQNKLAPPTCFARFDDLHLRLPSTQRS